MRKVYIYTLVDPISDQVRYIGKSYNPHNRYLGHLRCYEHKKRYSVNWIKSLVSKGLKPNLEIIDEVKEDSWEFWEQHYISLYKSWGFNLTNKTLGGGGTRNCPPWNKGKHLSEADKLKKSIANKGKKRTLEMRLTNSLTHSKAVLQYDLEGRFVKEWVSAKEVQKNGMFCKGAIKRKRPSKGFFFFYKEGNNYSLQINIFDHLRPRNKNKSLIEQYSLNGELVKTWDNKVPEIQKTYKGDIKACLSGRQKTAAGFIWKYKNDNY